MTGDDLLDDVLILATLVGSAILLLLGVAVLLHSILPKQQDPIAGFDLSRAGRLTDGVYAPWLPTEGDEVPLDQLRMHCSDAGEYVPVQLDREGGFR